MRDSGERVRVATAPPRCSTSRPRSGNGRSGPADPTGRGRGLRASGVDRTDPANLDRVVSAYRDGLMPWWEETPSFCSNSLLVNRRRGAVPLCRVRQPGGDGAHARPVRPCAKSSSRRCPCRSRRWRSSTSPWPICRYTRRSDGQALHQRRTGGQQTWPGTGLPDVDQRRRAPVPARDEPDLAPLYDPLTRLLGVRTVHRRLLDQATSAREGGLEIMAAAPASCWLPSRPAGRDRQQAWIRT